MNHKEALEKIAEITANSINSSAAVNRISTIATEAINAFKEERTYSEKEVRKAFNVGFKAAKGVENPYTVERDFLQSLQPKTEEQTYGEWMRSNPEQPTSPSIEKEAEDEVSLEETQYQPLSENSGENLSPF